MDHEPSPSPLPPLDPPFDGDAAAAVPAPDSASVSAAVSASGGPGRIVLAATPIGNAGDASARLVELLATADIVAAEDTRRLHRLVQNLGVTVAGRIISYHEHNEAAKTADLLDAGPVRQDPGDGDRRRHALRL